MITGKYFAFKAFAQYNEGTVCLNASDIGADLFLMLFYSKDLKIYLCNLFDLLQKNPNVMIYMIHFLYSVIPIFLLIIYFFNRLLFFEVTLYVD